MPRIVACRFSSCPFVLQPLLVHWEQRCPALFLIECSVEARAGGQGPSQGWLEERRHDFATSCQVEKYVKWEFESVRMDSIMSSSHKGPVVVRYAKKMQVSW